MVPEKEYNEEFDPHFKSKGAIFWAIGISAVAGFLGFMGAPKEVEEPLLGLAAASAAGSIALLGYELVAYRHKR